MSLNVLFVVFSLARGGAAIAAARFYALLQHEPDIRLSAVVAEPPAQFAHCTEPSPWQFRRHFFWRLVSELLNKLSRQQMAVKHSLNLFSSAAILKRLSLLATESSIVHVHWINNDSLSVFRLGDLPAGSILTLHDEWLYCASEHYAPLDAGKNSFKDGYGVYKSLLFKPFVLLSYWAKYRALNGRQDLTYTVPSVWLQERAMASQLLAGSDIKVLPNPINTLQFCALSVTERTAVRASWGVPDPAIVICFGAVGGQLNPLKGYELLLKALQLLPTHLCENHPIQLVEFGGKLNGSTSFGGYPLYQACTLGSAEQVSALLASADICVVPSRIESFGQVAVESLSCETPVVCFATSGLLGIVEQGHSGFLAMPFDTDDLARNLAKLIKMSSAERKVMGQSGRAHVLRTFDDSVVKRSLLTLYEGAALKSKVVKHV